MHKRIYSHHLHSTVSNCGRYHVITSSEVGNSVHVSCTKSRCKSWSCPRCRRWQLRRLRARLHQLPPGLHFRFCTLTIPCPDAPDESTLIALRTSWRTFIRRLRNDFPKVVYVRVLDIGQGGNFHLHLLLSSYIPISYLRSAWQNAGGGWNCDIRDIPNDAAAAYVIKYSSSGYKSTHAVEEAIFESGTRRFSFSRYLPSWKPLKKFTLEFFGNSSIRIDDLLSRLESFNNHLNFSFVCSSVLEPPPISNMWG
jgi:hypothetical protein